MRLLLSTLLVLILCTPASAFLDYGDIVGLWTACNGYLKSDGTCDTAPDSKPDVYLAYADSGALESAKPCASNSGDMAWTTDLNFYICDGVSWQNAGSSVVFTRLEDIIFDDFNRTDSNPLSGSWATVPDFNPVQIVSGIARGGQSGPTSSMAYRTDATPTGKAQWASIEIGAGQSVAYQGVMLRNLNATNGTFYVVWTTNATTIGVHRWTDGTDTAIGGITVPTLVPGDVLRAEIEGPDVGPRIQVYVNDILVGTLTDDNAGQITSVGTWAIHTLGTGATGLDNFKAGNILYEGTTQPVFDSAGENFAESGTSVSVSHTMGVGANGILLAWVGWDSTTESLSSVTYEGVPMTAVLGGSGEYANHTSGAWYYTLAPTPGTKTIVATLTGGSHFGLLCQTVSFTGVLQASPIEDVFVTDGYLTNVANLAFPKSPADIVVDGTMAIWSGGAVSLTAGSNQTERVNTMSAYGTAGISTEDGPTYDGTDWTLGGDKDHVNIAFTLKGL